MLKTSHWIAIGGVVTAGLVLAAFPLVHRADASAPAALTADETTQIQRLDVTPAERLTPGAQLAFSLQGTPNSQATVRLPGVPAAVEMKEVSPGDYRGVYTIGQNDRLGTDSRVYGELKHDGRMDTAPLTEPLVVAAEEKRVVQACTTCGTVLDVRAVEVGGNPTGVGGVAGGVLGAVVGHQFGGGNGRALASIAGAVGGAMAGNAVERNMKRRERYDVVVQMADGRRETVSYDSRPPFRNGESVRLEAGTLRAANA